MEAAERSLLRQTVRDAVAGVARGDTASADAVLAELGWLEMLAAEPADALDIVFGALGAFNATAGALDDVIVAALGLRPRADLAALLPPFATWAPPGRVESGRVHARGLTSGRATAAAELLVVCADRAAVVPASNSRLTRVRGIDADAGVEIAHVDAEAATVIELLPAAWDRAVASARRAVAHEIAAATRVMLDLARQHARDRTQFGRPVARFQAVRHRLADALIAIEALDACLAAAGDEPGPLTAALAKAAAGRAAHTVAAHCQQVLAGIGFTTDHEFHRYLKRTMLLDGLFGRADDIVVAIGHELLASHTVPTLIEL